MPVLNNRYEFVGFFEVTNGNPNGDPDAGNLPRMDIDTNLGLTTDVCLKRKIRNYVEMRHDEEAGFNIFVKESSILNEQQRLAYKAVRPNDPSIEKAPKLNPKDDDEAKGLLAFMCQNFFDVRTFGAVMGTGVNVGAIRGPVQFGFARSVEPILPVEITITRMAATSAKELKDVKISSDGENERTDNRTMGRKHIVPYGLYRVHGFISAKNAQKSGFSEADLEVFFDALENMFEHDHSAARGEMSMRKLFVFKHESEYGNAPAHTLFDLIKVFRNVDGERLELGDARLNDITPARRFSDYVIEIDREKVPNGVTLIERL